MAKKVIATESLTTRYTNIIALNRLDFKMDAGGIVEFVGPNGAGKTTTLGWLLGLRRQTAGTARIFSHHCQRKPVESHRRLD